MKARKPKELVLGVLLNSCKKNHILNINLPIIHIVLTYNCDMQMQGPFGVILPKLKEKVSKPGPRPRFFILKLNAKIRAALGYLPAGFIESAGQKFFR